MIRATSIKFKEDPLRVYRVARFASELNFAVAEDTINLMKELKKELNTLSAERVFCELRKSLATDKPSIFFEVLKQAEVLDVHFKEIYDLVGSEQPIKYHPEGDSYNHTMLAVDNSAKLTDDIVIRYSTLVHDLGKGTTPKEIYPHHYGHEERGVELVRILSNRIKVPTIWKKAGITACKEHMRGGIFGKMTPEKQVSFIERVSKSPLGLEGLQIVVYCDRNRIGTIDDEEEKQCTFVNIGKKLLNEIDGKYIKEKYNIKEGLELGKKIHEERVKRMRGYKCQIH
ncbi:MAG: HD domain-containing protein [Clostridia bacterium]|nr:HD domain-containing protein [Clostridia bacterium]